MPNKRKSKKKPTKQGAIDSVTQSEASTPTLENKENIDPVLDSATDTPMSSTSPEIPAGGPVGIGAKGAVAGNIIEDDDPVDSENTLELPDFIQTSIDNAVASRAVDTDAIISTIRQKVANGCYKEVDKPKAVENVQQTSVTNSETIDDTNASQTTALGASVPLGAPAAIANKSSPATNDAANPPTSLTENIGQENNVSALPVESRDSNVHETTVIGEGVPLGAPASIVTSSSPATSDAPNKAPVTLASGLTTGAKAVAATVVGAGGAAALHESTKPSENVEHAIKSVVDSSVVDFDDAMQIDKLGQKQDPQVADKKSLDIKRPEAAVGDVSQPAMPSSAKTADNPVNASRSKAKSSEHKPSFLKKKNCIIL
jgi:hypothetical protein